MLIDTHCHLDFKDFDSDLGLVLDRARAAGVGLIINVASSLEGSKRSVELAKKYDSVYASMGIHPHDVQEINDGAVNELRNLAFIEKKVVAIGEVGLDYYRDLSPRILQKEAFRKFIALSKELGLPLILHDRDAHRDTLDILKEEFGGAKIKGVMHCFSGDAAFLMECVNLGLHISFTCNITFKNASGLREVVRGAPIEKLLLETDAPFLAPQARRGKRNEPAYLTFLVEELSKIYALSKEDIARITTHNANELFNLGMKEKAEIAYEIRDSLYLNITNRCTNECDFCVRAYTDFVKGHNLKFDKEPSIKEILRELTGLDKYREVVFCGYGEPTARLDALKEIAVFLKQNGKRIRLVTNGHGNLINKRPIVKELAGLIDEVSVSLNTDTEEKYNKICRPRFGRDTFKEIKRFVVECKAAALEAEVTCLDLPETDVEKCRFIAESELGVKFRLRKVNVVG